MDDFKKTDIQLSESFNKVNKQISESKEKYLERYKSKNSDTVEALITLNKNKSYLRQTARESHHILNRHYAIKNMLLESFPLAEEKKISQALIKIGVLPPIFYVVALILISLIFWSVFNFFFFSHIVSEFTGLSLILFISEFFISVFVSLLFLEAQNTSGD